jgi:hypothetical protein
MGNTRKVVDDVEELVESVTAMAEEGEKSGLVSKDDAENAKVSARANIRALLKARLSRAQPDEGSDEADG